MNRSMTTMLMTTLLIGMQPGTAIGQLTIVNQFNPGLGTLVGVSFDPVNDRTVVYADFGSDLRTFSRAGLAGPSLTRPGESANDFDITSVTQTFTLGGTNVPAGSLLVINGESATADIYAIDPSTGTMISSLATSFGVSHVVGGAYHPIRNTIFLVQDKIPGGSQANLIAEINPVTGSVLNTFGTGDSNYTINFGDLEIHSATGNLYLASSDENSIRVLSPTGQFVQQLTLPGSLSLSGFGLDEDRNEAWAVSTNGTVYQLGTIAVPEPSSIILMAFAILGVGVARIRSILRRRTAIAAEL